MNLHTKESVVKVALGIVRVQVQLTEDLGATEVVLHDKVQTILHTAAQQVMNLLIDEAVKGRIP